MQGSHTHIPETNHILRGYTVAAILSLLFMVPLCLVPALVLLFFYLIIIIISQRALLRAYAKGRKATINLVTSVRPSAWNNSAPNGGIFMKFGILVFLQKNYRENSSF